MLRGRQSEVSEAWDALGVGQVEREKAEVEMGVITVQASNPISDSRAGSRPQSNDSHSNWDDSTSNRSFFEVFGKEVRSRTALAAFLLAMQQLSGIDGVLYVRYSFFNTSVSSRPASEKVLKAS